MKTPFVLNWLAGVHLYSDGGSEIMKSIFFTGRYEPNEFCFLGKLLRPGMTFIDAGANLGLYSLFASKMVGPDGIVLALEPSSREFRRLQRNMELNHCKNLRPLQLALSRGRSDVELLVAEEQHAGHNTLGGFAYDIRLQLRETVKSESLDEIVRQQGLSSVDVIKMDIEGAEYLALQGAAAVLSRFRPLLLVELSDRSLQHQSCTSGQIWDFLSEFGYRFYCFHDRTGLPVPAQKKPYFDSANIVAVHNQNPRMTL